MPSSSTPSANTTVHTAPRRANKGPPLAKVVHTLRDASATKIRLTKPSLTTFQNVAMQLTDRLAQAAVRCMQHANRKTLKAEDVLMAHGAIFQHNLQGDSDLAALLNGWTACSRTSEPTPGACAKSSSIKPPKKKSSGKRTAVSAA